MSIKLTAAEREDLADLCDNEAVLGPGKPGYCYRHHDHVEWAGRANASDVCCERVATLVADIIAARMAAVEALVSEARVSLWTACECGFSWEEPPADHVCNEKAMAWSLDPAKVLAALGGHDESEAR